jgi:succinoglycan biosynthesis protein ExoA
VPKSELLPSISIVIPVRDEAVAIRAALDSCLAQDYDGYIEIIVADAMSEDGTRSIVSSYVTNHNVTMIDNVGRSTPSGLNAAINASGGMVVVRCDAHSVLPSDYVSTAVEILRRTGAVNVGGIQKALGTQPMQRAIAAAMSSRFGVGDARFHTGGPAGSVDTVYLGVFDRAAVEAVGGFDERLIRNQDYELNIRLRKAGGTVWFDPELSVGYRPRGSWGALWRQYLEYGRWKAVVMRMHPESTRVRPVVPPLGIVGIVLGLLVGLRFRPALVLPVVYLAALTAAVVGARRPLIAPVLGCIHTAWATGFLSSVHR